MNQDLKILQERARALAQPLTRLKTEAISTKNEANEIGGEEILEVVEFVLAGQHFALETEFLGEVTSSKALTRLPNTPNWICGLVNVRSQVLAVIDLGPFFHLPSHQEATAEAAKKPAQAQILLVQQGWRQFGLVIESLLGTRFVRLSDLQGAPPVLQDGRSEWIRGITEGRLVVLDGARLINEEAFWVQSGN